MILLLKLLKTVPLNFTPLVAESYSATFSIDEHLAALHRYRNTSPGPDGIHNQMLPHLPPAGREFVLSMHNRIWTESSVPTAWREPAVIPILTPGRDRSLLTSY
jgi:hypothetical protein